MQYGNLRHGIRVRERLPKPGKHGGEQSHLTSSQAYGRVSYCGSRANQLQSVLGDDPQGYCHLPGAYGKFELSKI